MIQLLFLVLFAEGVVAFLLLVKIGPLRELVIKSLDQLKMGKGPATVKTIACTMSVILLSSFISIVKIQNKGVKLGTMSPMDQVLWRTHLLEASLMVGKRVGQQEMSFVSCEQDFKGLRLSPYGLLEGFTLRVCIQILEEILPTVTGSSWRQVVIGILSQQMAGIQIGKLGYQFECYVVDTLSTSLNCGVKQIIVQIHKIKLMKYGMSGQIV